MLLRPLPPKATQPPPRAVVQREAGGGITGLQPEELCNRATYAVEADFARALPRLRGLARRHAAELRQWQQADGVSPTLGALLALMRYLQGLAPAMRYERGDRRRLCGLGVQVPLRWLADILGRDKSTVCDALHEGCRRGYLLRYAPVRSVALVTRGRALAKRLDAVVTRDGVSRRRVNVHGVLYLTPQGAAWCDRRGTTWDDLGRHKRRLAGRRARVLTGLLADVLDCLRAVRRAIAARLSPKGQAHPTPDEETPPEKLISRVPRSAPAGSADPGLAVRPLAASDWIRSSRPQAGARGAGRASALPAPGNAPNTARSAPGAAEATHAGLSGKGTFSPGPAEPRRGYGPPLRHSAYLDTETSRCWTQHILVPGPPRRHYVRALVHGRWLGDFAEVQSPTLVWAWSPALTAEDAYPGEWSAARDLSMVRAQLDADMRLYLGPRLRRMLEEWEAAQGRGEDVACPVPGCECVALRGVPAGGRAAPAVPRNAR
ncbi:hypothetical protein OWM54_41910 [Myxococcus sp. MISCRS1]|uniref:hypothetical protein n=1 Tax=Myxococcus sp. MISCRS1 TaxID=2996786 RepID=UPI00226DBB07|nr:hypothetical protein [Myxococcus sp. MISCRS1]MCY1003720.1 hypothetical protein [Myxococcus sp. MISCRS1]